MIDLTKFLIINKTQFESILSYLDLDVSVLGNNYYFSYILTNMFAYLVIYLFIKAVLAFYYKMFSHKGGSIW